MESRIKRWRPSALLFALFAVMSPVAAQLSNAYCSPDNTGGEIARELHTLQWFGCIGCIGSGILTPWLSRTKHIYVDGSLLRPVQVAIRLRHHTRRQVLVLKLHTSRSSLCEQLQHCVPWVSRRLVWQLSSWVVWLREVGTGSFWYRGSLFSCSLIFIG